MSPFQGTAMPEAGSGSKAPLKPSLKVAEVAALLDVDPTTVYRLVKAGKIGAHRIGSGRGTVRIPAAAFIAYQAAAAATTPAVASDGLTIDTPLGPVDLVAIERARSGHQVTLTDAETAFFVLLQSRAALGVAR